MSLHDEVSMRSGEQLNGVFRFKYEDVSSPVAKFLRGQAERIREYLGKSVVDIGKGLIGAKHYLSHGAFLRWVESEVGIPARTAQAYMRVAQWVSGKSPTIKHLPPTILYLLSAPSTPQEFIVDILKRAEAGEQFVLPAIRSELKALRVSRYDEAQARACAGRTTKLVSKTADGAATVMEAIAILAHGLSASDFARVREIMTAKTVLDDPALPQHIETAFLSLTPWAARGGEIIGNSLSISARM